MDHEDEWREAALLSANTDALAPFTASQGVQAALDEPLSQIAPSVAMDVDSGLHSRSRLPLTAAFLDAVEGTAMPSTSGVNGNAYDVYTSGMTTDTAIGEGPSVIPPLPFASGIRRSRSIPVVFSVIDLGDTAPQSTARRKTGLC